MDIRISSEAHQNTVAKIKQLEQRMKSEPIVISNPDRSNPNRVKKKIEPIMIQHHDQLERTLATTPL